MLRFWGHSDEGVIILEVRNMTLTQYKKAIKSLSRDELETHLFEMFSASKVFKDVEAAIGVKDTTIHC